MSRRSPFVIELTKEEQAELDARSKEYTSPYREVMRAKIVLLASQGFGNDCIAARLGMPRQIVAAFPWHDGLSPSCDRRQWRAVLWQESVARRSGAGLARTHCVRGAIAAGYSRAIRSLPAKPAASSISTDVGGKVQRWGRTITYSASTRRPASRQDGADIVHCHQPRGARYMLSTNTPEPARWPISLRGTCSEPSYLVAASARTASPLSSGSSFRSCANNRIVRRVACS